MFKINICRVCEKSTNLINISLPNNDHYVVQYLFCANVSYELDDGLPPYLCRLCATQLNYAYKFKQKCEESEIKLKKMLSLSLETTDKCLNYLNADDSNEEDFKEDMTEDDFEEDLNEEDSNKFNESTSIADEKYLTSKFLIRCDICKGKKKFQGMNTLEKHMRKNHGMKNNHKQCPICFQWLKAYRFYIEHMKKNKHNNKDGKCKYCDKTFRLWNIKRHIKAVHFELRPFICDICNKSFATKTSVEAHIVQFHMSEYNYSCSVCNKAYKLRSSLRQHEISHNMPKREQEKQDVLICQFCGKLFKTKRQFLVHENAHTGKIAHTEKIAHTGKIAHKIRHVNTKLRLYECDICRRSFHGNGNLKTHKKTHSGIKPHKCNICNKSFALLANLQRHVLVHTGEKPFQCSYCEKSFSQSGSLKAHTRTHTGEKPYKCEHCSKCFSDCSTWIRHKKVHL